MRDSERFSVKVSRSIREIDKNQWDSVFPPIPESYGFLKTVEETLSGQFKFYYIAIYEASKIMCVAPCFLLDYDLATTLEEPLKGFVMILRKIKPSFFVARALVCGSPACEGRLGIKDSPNRHGAVTALVEKMRRIAKDEKVPIVAFKDFSDEYTPLLDTLLTERFHKVAGYPSVELRLSYKSFDEYFATLSSKTQIDLRRKFKKTDGKIKIEMEVRDNLGELLDEAYGLYADTLKKSDVYFEEITKDFFRLISKNMPGETKFFLWRIDEKLVAFHLCLISGGLLVAEYLGFDYDVAYKYHLYFVVFRDEIKWCIRNGIRRYETGPLNYDPKKRLDFKFVAEYIYFRHVNPLMNFTLRLIASLLKPENSDPVLKAMRGKYYSASSKSMGL